MIYIVYIVYIPQTSLLHDNITLQKIQSSKNAEK